MHDIGSRVQSSKLTVSPFSLHHHETAIDKTILVDASNETEANAEGEKAGKLDDETRETATAASD